MQEWIRLPTELLHSDLKRSSILVIAVLIDRDSGSNKVTITADEIAAKAGLSRRSVMYALKELHAAGYIKDICKSGRASTYTLQKLLEPKKRRQRKAEEAEADAHKYDFLLNKF